MEYNRKHVYAAYTNAVPKKKVNANRVCTGEINVHTSTHLQMCNNLYNYACAKLFN